MESDKISCVHCKSSQRLVISEQGCSIQGCLDTPGSLNLWFSIVYWHISINIYYAMKWKIKYFSTAPITRFFVDLLSTIRTLYILYKYMYVLCILSFFCWVYLGCLLVNTRCRTDAQVLEYFSTLVRSVYKFTICSLWNIFLYIFDCIICDIEY